MLRDVGFLIFTGIWRTNWLIMLITNSFFMKQSTIMRSIRVVFTGLLLFAIQTFLFAQEKAINVDVNEAEIGNWFERNWKWVVGGVVLLLIIVLFGGGGSRRRTTTVVRKDDLGNVKSVTTTEVTD
jgi:hypothetical protein